jgi:agmatine deiminase
MAEAHPDYLVCSDSHRAELATTPPAGRRSSRCPPATLTDAEGFVDYSYINHWSSTAECVRL